MKSIAKKILIVEDDTAISKVLQLKFQNAGFEVITCGDGKVCLATLNKETFDLVILDLILPEVDGFAVLERLKRDWKSAPPVVVFSNLCQTADIKRAKDLGVIAYCTKIDTDVSDLVQKVKQILERGS